MTVSASIPVAVLSITLFRLFSRRPAGTRSASILENNIVQTTGSAGESIAFGVGVTMPRLDDPGLRHEGRAGHAGRGPGRLARHPDDDPAPEGIHRQAAWDAWRIPKGTACAKVLIVGEQGGSSASHGLHRVRDGVRLPGLHGSPEALEPVSLPEEVRAVQGGRAHVRGLADPCWAWATSSARGSRRSPSRGASWRTWCSRRRSRSSARGAAEAIFPGTKPIGDMSAKDIRDAYILYIGAGAVAAGGVISLLQALPLILGSIKSGLGDLARVGRRGRGRRVGPSATCRCGWSAIGSTALVAAIATTGLFPTEVDTTGRIAGALDDRGVRVPVRDRVVAPDGRDRVVVQPDLGDDGGHPAVDLPDLRADGLGRDRVSGWRRSRSPGSSASRLRTAGTTSQDLKTGYLVGATPKSQQLAILVGALTSAIVIGFILLVLNRGQHGRHQQGREPADHLGARSSRS